MTHRRWIMNTDIKNCGLRDTVIRVDLSAIAENMEHICQLVGKETAVAAVVKANGYGHGARAIAPTLIEHGAALLAVATLEEALELKQAFPDYPVLVMGLTPDRALPYAAEYGIIQTKAIQMVAKDPNDPKSLKVPVIDTELCIGCGACEYYCPSRPLSAIYVEGHERHRTV